MPRRPLSSGSWVNSIFCEPLEGAGFFSVACWVSSPRTFGARHGRAATTPTSRERRGSVRRDFRFILPPGMQGDRRDRPTEGAIVLSSLPEVGARQCRSFAQGRNTSRGRSGRWAFVPPERRWCSHHRVGLLNRGTPWCQHPTRQNKFCRRSRARGGLFCT